MSDTRARDITNINSRISDVKSLMNVELEHGENEQVRRCEKTLYILRSLKQRIENGEK